MRSVGKLGDLIVCVLLILATPQVASLAADALAPYLSAIDPDGAFLWSTIHHIAQLALTLMVALAFGLGPTGLGFTTREREKSLSLLRAFVLYFVLFVAAGHVILYLTSPAPAWGHPLTPRNIAGELGFKALLSGTAEEPLFRGLVMMVLYRSWEGQSKWFGIRISHAGLIATALFVVAHIGFTVVPLRITWISPIQLVQAGVLGLFYAVAFDRTRSLLAPILAHNFANTIFTSLGMIWTAIG